MRRLIIKSRQGVKLKQALDSKRKETEGKPDGFQLKKRGKWRAPELKGWINLYRASGRIVLVKVHCLAPRDEWEIICRFVGFLDRYLSDLLDSIEINYK